MNAPDWERIDAYLDGAMSPADAEEFRRWLALDREHVRALVRACHDHATLAGHWAAQDGIADQSPVPEPPADLVPRFVGHRILRWCVWAPAAAFILLGTWSAWIRSRPTAMAPAFEATLLAGDLQMTRGTLNRMLRPGETLLPGDTLLVPIDGHASIASRSGEWRFELAEHALLRLPGSGREGPVEWLAGAGRIDVASPLPSGDLRLRTPQGELRIPPARLRLFASPRTTRVRMSQGGAAWKQTATAATYPLADGQSFVFGSSDEPPRLVPAASVTPNLAESPAPSETEPAPILPEAPPGGGGVVLRELWLDLGGRSLEDLKSHPDFPDSPRQRDYPTRLEVTQGGSALDHYGSRWRGYVHPPVTGVYTFWIAADDQAEFLLSPSENPGAARPTARVPAYTLAREWTKYAEQESADIALEAGRRYYFEILHKEDGGGDHVAVAWQIPGHEPSIVDGRHLSSVPARPRP